MKNFFLTLFVCAVLLNMNMVLGRMQTNENTAKEGLDIKDAIEKFLKDLQANVPELFTFADVNFIIPNNKYIGGTINFSNITCTGLKEFNATVIYRKFLPFPKAYRLFLENISLHFEYNSDVTFYNSKYLYLFGQGSTRISLKNLVFDGNVSVSVLPVNASTSANIDLGGVLVNVTGLLNDENFSADFGNFLGSSMTKIFDESKSVLSKALTNVLNFIFQQILIHHDHKNETFGSKYLK